MDEGLTLFDASMITAQSADDLLKYNEKTREYGLTLTREQALRLAENRSAALKETGRVEFGKGIIGKLIDAFCDSPYLSRTEYEETLHELTGIFYYYKNETQLGDDELIAFMRRAFDGPCKGSLELLSDRELEGLAMRLKTGTAETEADDACSGEENEEY